MWLIWKRQSPQDFPTLDSVCDSDWSAVAHTAMALDARGVTVVVERIPANHRFASSLGDWQMESYQAVRHFRQQHVDE